jgi:hypothetical protein
MATVRQSNNMKQQANLDEGIALTDVGDTNESTVDEVAGVCAFTQVKPDHRPLLENLAKVLPELEFSIVLTRGGWHRVGGLLSADGARLAHDLREWIEQECDGDVDVLSANYVHENCIVTHLHGKTHYLVARTGDAPDNFIQLEIEELQEAVDHPLFEDDMMPDDIDDLIDPVGVTRLEQLPVGEAHYSFRRMTDIADYIGRMVKVKGKWPSIKRFMHDWARSSAGECGVFSDYWVFGLHAYNDEYGEPVIQAQPVSTQAGPIPRLEKSEITRGSKLANMIHGFDRDMGYPMAWYFYMLTHSAVPYQLVEAIHRDQMGAYDYLPARDLKILIDWYNKPYSV